MSALDRLFALDAPARLAARDASLFAEDDAVKEEVVHNLGWTHLAADAAAEIPGLVQLATTLRGEGLDDVVLLGMGGSSLASLVIGSVSGELAQDRPRLHVLDTTSPTTARTVLDSIDFARTVILVSSKSGTTVEPLSLYAVFRASADAALGREAAGDRFIAVTDPDSHLERLAAEEGFRSVVSSPANVGGRYSALTVFGLLPAALLGIDLERFVDSARSMETACHEPVRENPGTKLAAFAVDAHGAGRDKLTVIASPPLASFGLWVEQLVAESLGKEGTGIVPVVELSADKPAGYGRDRALAVVRYAHDDRLAGWAAQWRDHFPVIELVLQSAWDLSAEFVRWEHGVALMGPLLGVNPFGQPNVAAAKAATAAVLDGSIAAPEAQTEVDGSALTYAGALPSPGHPETSLGTAIGHAVAAMRSGDFLCVLAYLPDDPELLSPLFSVVTPASAELGVPFMLELGPRYLHSTGQLHKGGRNSGVFVLVSTSDSADVPVPGQPWGLRALHRAQAEGDLVTLAENDRRVMRIDLPDASPGSIAALVRGIADAAGIVIEEQ